MPAIPGAVSNTFDQFVNSEKTGGIVLVLCAIVSIAIANSAAGSEYSSLWQAQIAGLTLEHWINDALMTLFFLLIGLELERELYSGELSSPRNALLPMVAAIGGVAAPALIYALFNAGTPDLSGWAIPTATDVAFALGILALLGSRVPASLTAFVVAFAVLDDLCAILIIGIFYTAELSLSYLTAALLLWAILCLLNRRFRVMLLTPYLIGGALMWVLMYKSGVHATVTGVLLAFAIPFSARSSRRASPSHRLERFLQKPVALLVLPIFALANTAIVIGPDWVQGLTSSASLGIITALLIGKPLGITLFCLAAVATGLLRLPEDLGWRHIIGAGILGGIGFTMSIFITNLAFSGDAAAIDAAKMAILLASVLAGVAGFIWLLLAGAGGHTTSPSGAQSR